MTCTKVEQQDHRFAYIFFITMYPLLCTRMTKLITNAYGHGRSAQCVWYVALMWHRVNIFNVSKSNLNQNLKFHLICNFLGLLLLS